MGPLSRGRYERVSFPTAPRAIDLAVVRHRSNTAVTITDEGDLPDLSLSVDPSSIAEEDDDGTTSFAENVSTVTVGITNGKTFAVDKTATLTFSGTATQGTHPTATRTSYSVSPGDADSGTGGHQVVLPKETASVEVTDCRGERYGRRPPDRHRERHSRRERHRHQAHHDPRRRGHQRRDAERPGAERRHARPEPSCQARKPTPQRWGTPSRRPR